MAKLRLPDKTQRMLIAGKTGSGKTRAASWQLSEREFDEIPWIIFDWKTEPLFDRINLIKRISIREEVPTKAGLYIVRPRPDEEGEVEAFLWKIWERGKVGIYVDEGYMLPKSGKSPAFQSILTQGRSKEIPVIILTQRPVWLTRFAISESDFYQIFWMNDVEDRKTIGRFIPDGVNTRLADYHSIWYDVGKDRKAILAPSPSDDRIVNTFNRRLEALYNIPDDPKIRGI